MGTRHAAVLGADPDVELLTLDRVPERARALAERFGGRAVDRAPEDIDVAVVATPTHAHVEVARPLLERGVWCLVEKPAAPSVAEARELRHPRCVLGHVERFNPAVRAAGALAPATVEARRVGPPTGRGLDVDVVLDLMIHDLDLLLGWAGPEPRFDAIAARGDADTAEVELRLAGGFVAHLVASRVAPDRERRIRVREADAEDAVELDLLVGRAWRGATELRPSDGLDGLTTQWRSFVREVGGGPRPAPDRGVAAVELAEAIRAAIG